MSSVAYPGIFDRGCVSSLSCPGSQRTQVDMVQPTIAILKNKFLTLNYRPNRPSVYIFHVLYRVINAKENIIKTTLFEIELQHAFVHLLISIGAIRNCKHKNQISPTQ